MQPNISVHDLDFKIKNVRSFLEEGKRVKISVRFRGRQMAHMDIGRKLLDSVKEKVADIGVPEGHFGMEGRMMTMLLIKKAI